MSLIPELVAGAVVFFRANPRKCAHIVAAALGYLVVAASVIDEAIVILKQVLVGLGAQ